MSDQQALYDQAARALDRLRTMDQPAALAYLKQMDPTLFEYLTALLFEARGYSAAASGKPGDEGVDVMLRDGDYVGVVQCKRYGGSVGQPTIRDLYGTMMHNEAEEAYLVTSGTVTRQAREWAFGKPIYLIDGHALAAWVTQTESAGGGGFSLGGLLRSRWVRWPLIFAGLLIFGWGVFYAVTQLSDRFTDQPVDPPAVQSQVAEQESATESSATESSAIGSSASDSEQAPVADETARDADQSESVAVAEAVSTPTVIPPTSTSTTVPATIPTAVPTAIPTAVPTVTPTVAPTITPLPTKTSTPPPPPPTEVPAVTSCAFAVEPTMGQWYERDRLGCATGEMRIVWAAWQPFERGAMLWRSDADAAYVFVASPQQQWFQIRERWDGSASGGREEDPPPGLQAPVRGFGYAWGVNDALFAALGWATDGEKGFCLALQPFDQGTILQSNRARSCTEEDLFNQARSGNWRPFTFAAYQNGAWE